MSSLSSPFGKRHTVSRLKTSNNNGGHHGVKDMLPL